MEIRQIVISRTDAIGDVILTLPMAGLIKTLMPTCRITFLGRTYTEPIIKRSAFIDEFINWDKLSSLSIKERTRLFSSYSFDVIIHVFPFKPIAKLAKQAKIPIRIGTSHRFYHLFNCNKLINLGRKNADLHEAQLNLKLLQPIGIDKKCTLKEIPALYGFSKKNLNSSPLKDSIDPERFNLILHPTSRGSAREWGLENFSRLIELLPKNKFKIFVTGTNDDKALIEDSDCNIVIQINGKKRSLIKLPINSNERLVIEKAKQEKNVKKYLIDNNVKKQIYVKNRLINFII